MTQYRKFDPRAFREEAGERTLATLAALAAPTPGNQNLKPYRGETSEVNIPRTLAGLATLAGCHRENESSGSQVTPPIVDGDQNQIQTCTPAKVAKAAKVGEALSFIEALAALEQRCPAYVDPVRWQQCVEDGKQFLGRWGEQAEALGWLPEELFGLVEVPTSPHPTFDPLARFDCLGLIWLLQSKVVAALTAESASIRHKSGTISTYRRDINQAADFRSEGRI